MINVFGRGAIVVASVNLTSSLPQPDTSSTEINTLLSIVFTTIGAISVLIITLAGLRYITSAGNPQAIEQSKNAILYAVVGLVVSIAAFSIVNFVIGNL